MRSSSVFFVLLPGARRGRRLEGAEGARGPAGGCERAAAGSEGEAGEAPKKKFWVPPEICKPETPAAEPAAAVVAAAAGLGAAEEALAKFLTVYGHLARRWSFD